DVTGSAPRENYGSAIGVGIVAGELPAANDTIENTGSPAGSGGEPMPAFADRELIGIRDVQAIGAVERAQPPGGAVGVYGLDRLSALSIGASHVVHEAAIGVVQQYCETLVEAALDADVHGVICRAALIQARYLNAAVVRVLI